MYLTAQSSVTGFHAAQAQITLLNDFNEFKDEMKIDVIIKENA